MAEIIEHLEQVVEQEKQQNADLAQDLDDATQEIQEIKEDLNMVSNQGEYTRKSLSIKYRKTGRTSRADAQ